MNILYIIIAIILFLFMILLPLKEEKSNLLKRISLSIVTMLGLNIFECICLYIFNIRASLLYLSIINIIISLILLLYILKNKKIQKFEIKTIDIVFVLLLTIIIIIIGVINYKIPINVKYGSTDASSHFSGAINFMNDESILINDKDELSNYFGFDRLMIGAYTNTGIFFSVFKNIVSNMYSLYIIFDLFMLVICGILMFLLVKEFLGEYVSMLIPIIYVCGYPLNSVIMGCAYLTLSLIFICSIILLFNNKDKIPNFIKYSLLFLFNLGLVHTYIMFSIVVFLAEIIYLIIKEKKKSLKYILISIIIPLISAIIYTTNIVDKMSVISTEGPMYKNYYSNFIIFIPFIIYSIFKDIKNKKYINIENILLCINLIVLIVAVILKNYDVLSSYYYFKLYYLLWIICFFIASKGISYLKHKKIFLSILFCVLSLSFILIDIKYNENEILNDVSKESLLSVSEIYRINYNYIKDEKYIFNQDELNIIKKYKDFAINNKNDITIIGGMSQINWVYALYDFAKMDGLSLLEENSVNNLNSKYILCFKRASIMHRFKNDIMKKYEYIYQNKYGGVMKKIE